MISRAPVVPCYRRLASGTCQRGCLAEIWGRAGQQVPPPLVPGNVVTLEVEGIGLVSNKVVDPGPGPGDPEGQARPAEGTTPLIGGVPQARQVYVRGFPPL